MKIKTKRVIKIFLYPAYMIYRKILHQFCMRNSKQLIDNKFFMIFNRHINWDNPGDLNEKINWLKLHADMHEWALFADKYAVRDYVQKKGLQEILIPLYGKYNNIKELMEAWDTLPEEFVLKSNNGCGHVKIISKENGGKKGVNKRELFSELTLWLSEYDYGIKEGEFQYQYIKNCIIAEKLLIDDSISDFSNAPIDYKIHCCNGKPYICYVAYGRSLGEKGEHKRVGNLYDLEWNEHPELMAVQEHREHISKPKNWEKMLDIATTLSDGQPQTRIDLYNISGKIYFGEITMTNAGGYDTEYKPEVYEGMGREIELDLSMPVNEFYS